MPNASSWTKKTVLVVDDSDDDYEALTRVFRANINFRHTLHRCETGQQALDLLCRRGTYQDPDTSIRPNLILLDLNMPGIDGHRVLAELKGHASLKSIPVIIMTTSDDKRDITSCYEAGANSYIQKPTSSECLHEAVQRVTDFWLEFAMLPDAGDISGFCGETLSAFQG